TLTSQRTLLVDLAYAGDTTKHPPTVSSFPPGGSGWIKSALGGAELLGNGQGDWPWLRTHPPIAGTWQLGTPFTAVNPSESTIGGYALSTVDSNPDIDNYLSLNVGAGDGVWTVLVDGFYRIDTRVSWPANTSGHRYLRPRIDGTNVDSVSMGPGNGGNISLGHVIPMRWLTAGQTFRVRQMQNSGSDLTIPASSSAGQTFVHIQYLGRAA
ncbi:MAG: hypothetical protein JWM40_680, partial [Frankiales bacterium]|nr:hypothetical protein [Frankiales bacterium]